jgi:hypothetical protein
MTQKTEGAKRSIVELRFEIKTTKRCIVVLRWEIKTDGAETDDANPNPSFGGDCGNCKLLVD